MNGKQLWPDEELPRYVYPTKLTCQYPSKGYRVVIGSRSSEKGEASAAALRSRLPSSEVTGTGNRDGQKRPLSERSCLILPGSFRLQSRSVIF